MSGPLTREEAIRERNQLAAALGNIILAAGVIKRAPFTPPLTLPQLLLFAEDVARDLKRYTAQAAEPAGVSH